MRRLPLYFVLDVSESMVGEPIEHVCNEMLDIIQAFCKDPWALETIFVSVIAFSAQSELLAPLTELSEFSIPKITIKNGQSVKSALDLLGNDIDVNVVKTTCERKGDWNPIIVLFTMRHAGCESAITDWKNKYNRCSFIIVSDYNTDSPKPFLNGVIQLNISEGTMLKNKILAIYNDTTHAQAVSNKVV